MKRTFPFNMARKEKRCPCCETVKLVAGFSKNKSSYDGLNGHCKPCVSIAKKKWSAKNRDAIYLKDKLWKETNRDHVNALRRKNKKTPTEREKDNLNCRLARAAHPTKFLARGAVKYQTKMGRIKKPDHCEVCKEDKVLQAHHHDYDKKLDITFVCYQCHADIHYMRIKEPKTGEYTKYPKKSHVFEKT